MPGSSGSDRNSIGPDGDRVAKVEASSPGEPWLVDVDVHLEDAGTRPPRFRLETCLPMAPDNPDQVIEFHNRGRRGFDIRFNLIDETNGRAGSGYCFPPNRKRHEALWSREGECCPPENYGEQWPQFTTLRVIEPDRTTLVVRNLNETETKFGYTLRVTNDECDSYLELDPVGDNRNGTV